MSDTLRPITLVLSAGGSWGWAHLGVLDVLQSEEIPIGRIVGSSAGALVGGLIASGADALVLEKELANDKEHQSLFSWKDVALSRKGLLKGDHIEIFLKRYLRESRLENFPVPFAAVVADIVSGKTLLLDSGNAAKAIHASVSVPGMFEPVAWDEHLLVDGGYGNPLPVVEAMQYGPSVVVAVDVLAANRFYQTMPVDQETITVLGVMDRSMGVLSQRLRDEEGRRADVLIAPEVPSRSWLDFSYDKDVVEAGRSAARDALEHIRHYCLDVPDEHTITSHIKRWFGFR